MRAIIRATLATAVLMTAVNAQAEIKTIHDVLGRDVKVDVPAKRVVLGFYYPDYIAATGSENFGNVVGISREFWEASTQAAGHYIVRNYLIYKILAILVMSIEVHFRLKKPWQ